MKDSPYKDLIMVNLEMLKKFGDIVRGSKNNNLTRERPKTESKFLFNLNNGNIDSGKGTVGVPMNNNMGMRQMQMGQYNNQMGINNNGFNGGINQMNLNQMNNNINIQNNLMGNNLNPGMIGGNQMMSNVNNNTMMNPVNNNMNMGMFNNGMNMQQNNQRYNHFPNNHTGTPYGSKNTTEHNYKTVPCHWYHSQAGCERGDKCDFIHDPEYQGRDHPITVKRKQLRAQRDQNEAEENKDDLQKNNMIKPPPPSDSRDSMPNGNMNTGPLMNNNFNKPYNHFQNSNFNGNNNMRPRNNYMNGAQSNFIVNKTLDNYLTNNTQGFNNNRFNNTQGFNNNNNRFNNTQGFNNNNNRYNHFNNNNMNMLNGRSQSMGHLGYKPMGMAGGMVPPPPPPPPAIPLNRGSLSHSLANEAKH